jgi:hypothetical protein
MQPVSIAAKDVKCGDHIYNPKGYCSSAKWLKVISVEKIDTVCTLEGGRVVPCEGVKIATEVFYTIKYPREGITVWRKNATQN